MKATPRQSTRLAIVTSHPIQYYAPWFRSLAKEASLETHVFYLWNREADGGNDRDFGKSFAWDIDLVSGYPHTFVPNVSRHPGTAHPRGLDNPALVGQLLGFAPDAILLYGYTYVSHLRLLLSPELQDVPIFLRGDSHILEPSPPSLRNWLRDTIAQSLFRRFGGFLSVGSANEEYFRSLGVPESQLFRAPHSVDNDRFRGAEETAKTEARQWREELGIPTDHIVFGSAAKFIPKKDPLGLIEAFRKADLPTATLLLVGSGPLEDDVRKAAQDDPRICIAPFQNQSRMPVVYAACDVFVLPSRGRSETWGLAINEAFNLGTPAIVSDRVGCHLDLITKETGWVFPSGNVEALSKCLRQAYDQRDELVMMGRAAQKMITYCSYQSTTQGLVRALQSTTSHKGAVV